MRDQFTFYRSFADALMRIKKKADRADAYDAICRYALYGEEPDLDALPDSAAIAFALIQPVIDAGKRKAESGRQGGSRPQASGKQTGSKQEASGKQTASDKEGEKEGDVEIEGENECYTPHIPPLDFMEIE